VWAAIAAGGEHEDRAGQVLLERPGSARRTARAALVGAAFIARSALACADGDIRMAAPCRNNVASLLKRVLLDLIECSSSISNKRSPRATVVFSRY
jgi:hypothetical protein